MKKTNQDEKEIATRILTDAFDQNPSVNFVVKQDIHRKSRIRALMEYSCALCDRFGEIWLSENKSGCALLLFPDAKRTSLQTILWDIKLAMVAIGLHRVRSVMRREALIRAFHPKKPFAYLWFIAVDPDHQRSGTGSQLLSRDCRIS